jgi:hypothetical protein
VTPAPEPDRDRIAALLEAHAPADWQQRFRTEELLDALMDSAPLQMSFPGRCTVTDATGTPHRGWNGGTS